MSRRLFQPAFGLPAPIRIKLQLPKREKEMPLQAVNRLTLKRSFYHFTTNEITIHSRGWTLPVWNQ
jgi:hypothetical protein